MDYTKIINQTDVSTFRNMIDITKRCLDAKGSLNPNNRRDFSEALKCETAYFSQENEYTFHTHPNGNPKPSEADINTTNKFHKKFMFIGLVPTRKVVVYGKKDNFSTMLGSFNV